MGALLSTAEPSWAEEVPADQLRALLVLSALLVEEILLSDVHLGDSRHFIGTATSSGPASIYVLARDLAREGVVRLHLRRSSVRATSTGASDVIRVESMGDVLASWQVQDDDEAWIVPRSDAAREAYAERLDNDFDPSDAVRYDYLATKNRYMELVRAEHGGMVWPPYRQAFHGLDPVLRGRYDEVLARPWFTLSDVYSLLNRHRTQPPVQRLMRANGLLNEQAQAQEGGLAMIASSMPSADIEQWLWQRPTASGASPTDLPPGARLEDRLLANGFSTDLSLLALLTADEVLELRQLGTDYFALLRRAGEVARSDDVEVQIALSLAAYWNQICDQIASRHHAASHAPTLPVRLAITRGGPPARIAHRVYSYALGIGGETDLESVAKTTTSGTAAHLTLARGLRLLLLPESEPLRGLRDCLPRTNLVTAGPP